MPPAEPVRYCPAERDQAMNSVEDVAHGDRVQERVADVVARIALQHDVRGEIAPADALVDRGMTSMAMVDLMLAIEAAFDA